MPGRHVVPPLLLNEWKHLIIYSKLVLGRVVIGCLRVYVLSKHELNCWLGPFVLPSGSLHWWSGRRRVLPVSVWWRHRGRQADPFSRTRGKDGVVRFLWPLYGLLFNLLWVFFSLCLSLNVCCRYKTEFMAVCHELLQLGLEEAEKRKTEREAFFHSHHQALSNNQCPSTDRVASYNDRKKEVCVVMKVAWLRDCSCCVLCCSSWLEIKLEIGKMTWAPSIMTSWGWRCNLLINWRYVIDRVFFFHFGSLVC